MVSQVIGHWAFSGLTQFQIGYPYGISVPNDTGWFNGAQYATRASGVSPYLSNPTVAQWFNPAAFTPTIQNTFGDTPRAALFGPGLNNFDLSILRNFPIKERYTFQIRGDFYNAFNHVQFDNLNNTCSTTVNGACGGSFGAATGDAGARTIQIDARVTF